MDPISTARYGMMAAQQSLDASAGRVVGMADPTSGVDYGQEAVSQIEAKQAFSANIGVIKVADEMWNALLNLQAGPARA
jgi:flagellar hook protein FlgE